MDSSASRKYEIRKRDPNPQKAALLVIDMQNYFSSMAKPILHNALTTIDLFRRASIPVIFTRHIHKTPTDLSVMLDEWWNGDLILDGTTDSEIIPEIDRKVKKTRRNCGEEHLQCVSQYAPSGKLVEFGVEEVIVIGVMTNLCCETTARDAFVKGYKVFFSTDATATVYQELHEATLINLAYGFAYLVDCVDSAKDLTKNNTLKFEPLTLSVILHIN